MKTLRFILHNGLITIAVIALCFHSSSAQNSFPTPTGPCLLDATAAGAGSGGQIRLSELDANGANYFAIKAPDALAGNQVYTWPNAIPSTGKVLSSDATGVLTWVKRAKTDLSNLDATTSINSDLLPDADNTRDLGSSLNSWDDLWLDGTGAILGNLGIGTSTPITKLQITGGADASLTGLGFMQLGATGGANIVFDDNEIIARSNAGVSTLFLQNSGGDLNISDGGLVVTGLSNDVAIGGELDVAASIVLTASTCVLSTDGSDLSLHPDVVPDNDDVHALGTSGLRWLEVWAVDGSINTSDARDKTNVKDIPYGLNEVLKLRPVTYQWINHPDNGNKLGLIAQDLQKVLPEVVRDWEWSGDENTQRVKVPSVRLGVMYDDIIPVLVKAIQEENALVAEKDSKIDNQQQQIIQLTDRIVALEATISQSGSIDGIARFSMATENAQPVLGQNIPNPFENSTLIPFRLPKNCKDASLQITESITGRILRVIPLVCGETQISIDAGLLSSGTYTYSLYVDANLIDTKQMILTK